MSSGVNGSIAANDVGELIAAQVVDAFNTGTALRIAGGDSNCR